MVGSLEENREMRTMFDLLEVEEKPGENRYILIQQISNRLIQAGEMHRAIYFLTTYAEQNPGDPYNGYYLGIVAEAYRDLGALPMAIHYYKRILMNYPDLLVSGNSIHFRCLQELILLVDDPGEKITYYKELIARFSDIIDPGITYYFLAQAYEEVGEWEQSIKAYQTFLKYHEVEIPGFPHAHVKIRQKVEVY